MSNRCTTFLDEFEWNFFLDGSSHLKIGNALQLFLNFSTETKLVVSSLLFILCIVDTVKITILSVRIICAEPAKR